MKKYILKGVFLVIVLSITACGMLSNTKPNAQNKNSTNKTLKNNQGTEKSLGGKEIALNLKKNPYAAKDSGKNIVVAKSQKIYIDYKIKLGDTLSNIAQRFKISETCLAKVNNIKEKDWIIAGHNLIIPSDNCS